MIRAFLRDERGSMTVEFMIWLPLITFWLVFSTAVFIAWDNRADSAKATFTIADIMSRRVAVDGAFLEQLYNLNQGLITNDGRRNVLRISSVRMEADGDLNVRWSCPMGDGVLEMENSSIPMAVIPTLPGESDPMIGTLDSVIIVESLVPYTPLNVPFASSILTLGDQREQALDEEFFDGEDSVLWTNRLAIRPRDISEVTLLGDCP
jgi:Flp pilus assembly protein TadG